MNRAPGRAAGEVARRAPAWRCCARELLAIVPVRAPGRCPRAHLLHNTAWVLAEGVLGRLLGRGQLIGLVGHVGRSAAAIVEVSETGGGIGGSCDVVVLL